MTVESRMVSGQKRRLSGRILAGSIALAWLAYAGSFGARAYAHEDGLPPGPLHDRHELMEKIGKSAKALGGALKAGDKAAVVAPARVIAGAAGGIVAVFPKGSTHPKSRAKSEIWDRFDEFEKMAVELQQSATVLARKAEAGEEIGDAGKAVMHACKQCHEAFRMPED